MVITRSELHRAALQDLRDAKVLEREAAADLLDLVREAGDLLDRLPTVVGSSAPRSRRSR